MMKKYGHLFKSYNKIPVHLIHLAGKIIHYGTKISHTSIRIRNSNKKFLWNCTLLPQEGTQDFQKLTTGLRRNFFCDGLKLDIQNFVVECLVFQQNKFEIIKNLGLLQLLSIPSQCWEEVSMDFIIGLPTFEGNSIIMVVVERLTKYAHFCVLSRPFKTNTVSTAFVEIIQKLHGNPKIIVSDRDPIFTRNCWT